MCQCSNPFLNLIDEDSEEEELIEDLAEITIELEKGTTGFGMEIAQSGHVVSNTDGGVAATAGTCRYVPK